LAAGGALWLWQAWPQVMMKSILWQREVNQQMSGLLKAVAENPTKRGIAAGVQLYLWRSARAGAGAWQNRDHHLACHPSVKAEIEHWPDAGLLAASGGVAIVLVVVVLSLLQLPARQLHMSSFWLEKGSYALVGVLGLILCWRALKKLRAYCKNQIQNLYAASRSRCPLRLRASASADAGTAAERRRLARAVDDCSLDGDAPVFGGDYGAAVQ
jgi:hypothetical protein